MGGQGCDDEEMTAVEVGIVFVLIVQVVQIIYLSAIWNRLLDHERRFTPVAMSGNPHLSKGYAPPTEMGGT